MFISIAKSKNRYAFIVGDNPEDPIGTFLYSERDATLLGSEKNYPTFREAHSHASIIAEEHKNFPLGKKAAFYTKAQSEFSSSPEDAVMETLESQPDVLDGLLMQIKGAKDHEKLDKLDALIKSIDQVIKGAKSVKNELHSDSKIDRVDEILGKLKVIQKATHKVRDEIAPTKPEEPAAPGATGEPPQNTPQSPQDVQPHPQTALSPFASKKSLPFAKDCLKAFGEASAQAIEASHNESYLKSIEKDASGDYIVTIASPEKELCVLNFNSDLLLNGIYPSDAISKQSSYHSLDFYERYWEPIVNAVGHFFMNGIVMSPHHAQSSRRKISGWNLNKKKSTVVNLTLPNKSSNHKTWMLKQAEESNPWENAQVRCLKKLPTYYQRTGNVQSVIPRGSYLDINVDFGRGLGVVTMTDSDLEKITDLQK